MESVFFYKSHILDHIIVNSKSHVLCKEGMMTFWIVGALRRVFEDFKSGVCITSVPMYKLKSA